MHFPEWKFMNFNEDFKFVPKGPINNTLVLFQIMAWRRSGNKPLSEPMIVSLLMNMWIKASQNTGTLTYYKR